MILLGLSGPAGCGKSAVAEYLVKRYGFLRFSFSDALYREVTEAFDLPHDSILRNRDTKEVATPHLALAGCADEEFVDCMIEHLACAPEDHTINTPHSPREILQIWGTEYRRAQDPDYWISAANDWLIRTMAVAPYAELRQTLFVNDSVRFENEREWVNSFAPFDSIWHLHRDGLAPVHPHESETPLLVLDGEREIWNNADLAQLYRGADLLLSTSAAFVRCEPMLPMNGNEEIADLWQTKEQS